MRWDKSGGRVSGGDYTDLLIAFYVMCGLVGAIIGATTIEGAAVSDGSYRLAFGFMALMAMVTWLCYYRVKDCPPSEQ